MSNPEVVGNVMEGSLVLTQTLFTSFMKRFGYVVRFVPNIETGDNVAIVITHEDDRGCLPISETSPIAFVTGLAGGTRCG
jgi:hypothetical protein